MSIHPGHDTKQSLKSSAAPGWDQTYDLPVSGWNLYRQTFQNSLPLPAGPLQYLSGLRIQIEVNWIYCQIMFKILYFCVAACDPRFLYFYWYFKEFLHGKAS